jgi:asparagine synthase (glutamine-hydrolysing)
MPTPVSRFELKGWVELDGRRLAESEIGAIVADGPLGTSRFGGEFFLRWDDCRARDWFGVIPGDCPKGTIVCSGEKRGEVNPDPVPLELEDAILTAIRLRSDEGVTAFSGGVDSAFVAKIAGRECVAVGLEGSHDLKRAAYVARELGLRCECVTINPDEIERALRNVVTAIPTVDPVNASIAATEYFIARWACEQGCRRIITGQGADELFGGYSRYLESADPGVEMERDFLGLAEQGARDQAVAAMHGTYFSLPYLDIRVVRAARAVPHRERMKGGVRKHLLRSIAERHIPREIAWYDKKAMQYGTGVMKVIRGLARKNGYSRSLQGYLDYLRRAPHGE